MIGGKIIPLVAAKLEGEALSNLPGRFLVFFLCSSRGPTGHEANHEEKTAPGTRLCPGRLLLRALSRGRGRHRANRHAPRLHWLLASRLRAKILSGAAAGAKKSQPTWNGSYGWIVALKS